MLLRTQFELNDDGNYYYLYVTDEVRIESKGQGMTVEDKKGTVLTIDPIEYLDDDLQFQLGLSNPYIEVTKKAVRIFYDLMN